LSGTGSSECGGSSAGTIGYNSREGPACFGELRPTVMAMTIADEIAAEVTALAMGWVPVKGENGTRIWVRSKDIGVDNAPYCDTALEVVRTYTH
jgi:hypothetical protein